MKRFIVTGGAGLIGSALVYALNMRGLSDILIVERLDSSDRWKNLVPLQFSDLVDADEFERRILQKPTAFRSATVFHLGACSSTTETDAAFLLRNNYQYTKNVAQWAIERGFPFLYASSAATYGALEDDLSDGADLSTLRPLNMYAYSKHLFDIYARNNDLFANITGLKYFNIFGPNEQHKGDMRSLVDKAYRQIMDSGTVKLFKSYRPEFRDGEQKRDFLYVKDAVEMTIHLAEYGATGLYNIGSGFAQTWLDLVRPIFRAAGVAERVEFVEMPLALRNKYQYFTQANMDRFKATGYQGRITPLSDAVDDYVRNYLILDRRLDPSHDGSLVYS